MESKLFNFLLEIPKVVSLFATWLTSPLHERYLNITPLALLGVGGFSILVSLIVVHIVKLFI